MNDAVSSLPPAVRERDHLHLFLIIPLGIMKASILRSGFGISLVRSKIQTC